MPLPPLVEPVEALSRAEAARAARHLVLADLGELGQRRLRAAHVAVVGAGGLGSPVVLALAAAGIGTLTVIDDDTVELSNLQRQVLHRLADVDAPKVDSAVRVAGELSPETIVRPVRERLTAANADTLLAGADVVIDGSDSFETRSLVAAACERSGVPLVWGVVQEFAAQVTVFWSDPPAGTEPVVLRDLYPPEEVGALPSCAAVGVLGALCLQVGSLLAMETIKLVAGIGEPLFGRVLLIDALRGRMSEVPLRGSRAATTGAAAEAGERSPAAGTRPADSGARLVDPEARAVDPEARAVGPETRAVGPETRAVGPEGRAVGPAGRAVHPQRLSVDPETRPVDHETRPVDRGVPTAGTAPRSAPPGVPHVDVAALAAEVAAGAAVLDVREAAEVATGMIPGAEHVPLGEVLAAPARFADSGRIVVVCQAGMRAARAARALRAAGADAVVLTGGMMAWAAR
ncbi:HesA/MoeB/ThiF family protein [Microbacterium sp. p3-SID336]|uniref:HesA/MoeB/ThiF family protein n=1 Tax=Microbacterium sp. p3-SID336 TaxID=2916212 RepID=UPI0021A52C26|nr:HesA/MoeB/ThiF family protein [Microbacterium sp. p3-SID336]MCT1478330.1 HesA/MoeB/ThiF family protein [Microbacterium sp. p3-SID336]